MKQDPRQNYFFQRRLLDSTALVTSTTRALFDEVPRSSHNAVSWELRVTALLLDARSHGQVVGRRRKKPNLDQRGASPALNN
jgi:hypothetical protein